MKEAPPSHNLPRIMVRVSDELRGRLQDAADAAGRSLSAEVAVRLEQSFAGEDEVDTLLARVDATEMVLRHLTQEVRNLRSRLDEPDSTPGG